MDNAESKRPEDVEATLRAQIRRYEAKIAEQQATIASQQERIYQLLAKRFGASAETLPDGQLGLFNEAEDIDDATNEDAIPGVDVPAHTRKSPKRSPLPETLPRIEVVHDLDEADKVCPHDGSALEQFGEETSEQLDIVPAKVRVLRHIRLKYRCPCCDGSLRRAPMTPQPIPKSMASPGLLAHIVTAKFVDALPLYRQVKQFDRIGVMLSRATLASWMIRMGEHVQPLINLLRDELLSTAYLQMDETRVQVLKEPGKTAESLSYLWAQRSVEGRPIVLFDYDPTRSNEVPKRLLAGFTGALHTDGYAGYDAFAREAHVTRLYCFAHARRRFVDAIKALGLNPKKLPAKPPDKARRTLKGLRFIRHLYDIERRIADQPPDERYRIRQAESAAVLGNLRQWLDKTITVVLPNTALGKALAYLDKHWHGLTRYIDDGRFKIDTNLVENAIRPFCVGRRNWMFSDSVDGAKASANLYSLIETAKANAIEPYAYLRYVFTELPKATTVEHIEALLPYRLDHSTLHTGQP